MTTSGRRGGQPMHVDAIGRDKIVATCVTTMAEVALLMDQRDALLRELKAMADAPPQMHEPDLLARKKILEKDEADTRGSLRDLLTLFTASGEQIVERNQMGFADAHGEEVLLDPEYKTFCICIDELILSDDWTAQYKAMVGEGAGIGPGDDAHLRDLSRSEEGLVEMLLMFTKSPAYPAAVFRTALELLRRLKFMIEDALPRQSPGGSEKLTGLSQLLSGEIDALELALLGQRDTMSGWEVEPLSDPDLAKAVEHKQRLAEQLITCDSPPLTDEWVEAVLGILGTFVKKHARLFEFDAGSNCSGCDIIDSDPALRDTAQRQRELLAIKDMRKEMCDASRRLASFKGYTFFLAHGQGGQGVGGVTGFGTDTSGGARTAPPRCTPRTLAEAGFFYAPLEHSPDGVACYSCGVWLCGWKPDDDPVEVHHNIDKAQVNNCAFLRRGDIESALDAAIDTDVGTGYPTPDSELLSPTGMLQTSVVFDSRKMRVIFDSLLDGPDDFTVSLEQCRQVWARFDGFGIPQSQREVDRAFAQFEDKSALTFDEFSLLLLKRAKV